MSRRQRWWTPLAIAAMILVPTAAVAAANPAAGPAHAATRAAMLRTTVLATWGSGGYLYDVNRSGQVLGALNDAAHNPQAVLWRDYAHPVALGIDQGSAQALNNRGHVAGIGGRDLPTAGWLWRPGRVTYLQLPSWRVWVSDVNDRDQVVGVLDDLTGNAPSRPFLWQDGRFTDLGAPAGMTGYALKVNNRGQVLGSLYTAEEPLGFVWSEGAMTILRAPGGGEVRPVDINDRGQVIGIARFPGTADNHPFLWHRGRMVDLLAGQPPAFGWASDINDAGEIAGGVHGRGAVVWRRDGRMIELGVAGDAYRINDRGDVAGIVYSYTPDDTTEIRVYRWRQGRLLFSAPVVGSEVGVGMVGIDERGRILGSVDDGRGGRPVAWTS